jgi:probable DNA metabolism protein
MNIQNKLEILAGAAKYDVSCASSGSRRENRNGRLGNAAPSGICHSFTEDGRCVSLLKVLFTNFCIYDCAYCANRAGNDLPRAAFTPAELADLTIDFYRRNFIEGLFLSSGVIRSPDDTMELLIRTVRDLRSRGFNGYIHLKCVPYTSRPLIREAGLHADRLSVNIELPSEDSLRRLAGDKTYRSVLEPMGVIRETILETSEDRRRLKRVPAFAPAGQSTQLIIGASPESDYDILHASDRLYQDQALKRVYYSGYVPINAADPRLPEIAEPPLARENRLYQADWLMRLYGYSVEEVIRPEEPYLDLKIDPKLAFARRQPDLFPVDINSADYSMILKVPGIGLRSAKRIVSLRRQGHIRYEHLQQMGVALNRARDFISCPGQPKIDRATSRPGIAPQPALPTGRKLSLAVPSSTCSALPLVFLSDGTFEGLLTAIFETYDRKVEPVHIRPRAGHRPSLFESCVEIACDPEKAERVWRGIKRHLGSEVRSQIHQAYLTGEPDVETLIYRRIRLALPLREKRADVQAPAICLAIERLSQKVCREAHRMKGLVRFTKTEPDLFWAMINPRYDILPLVRRHFEKRYADQSWVIFDTVRNYGLYFDKQTTREMRSYSGPFPKDFEASNADEETCRRLWKTYFIAVNVTERNNPRLHLRQLPRRYWQYLPEKNLD